MSYFEQNKADMIAYLQKGCKPKGTALRFGVELEHFIVKKDTKEAVSYYGEKGVETILKQLLPFYEKKDYSEGHLIALARKDIAISLEPAAQLEVSISPQEEIEEIGKIYEKFVVEIAPVLEQLDYEMVTAGYQPASKVENLELIPKDRYRFMDAYFAKIGPYGRQMMRGTAATQVSIDYYSEDDFKEKYKAAYQLMESLSVMYENTPVYEGQDWKEGSLRAKIWKNTDKRRFAVEPFMENGTISFEGYVDFIMQAPIIVNKQNGVEFYDEKTIGEICAERRLTEDEMIHAMSMVFPMIRAKQFLEIRYADSMPIERVLKYVNEIKRTVSSSKEFE